MKRALIAASSLALLMGAVHSQGTYTELGAFKSPSGNIYCVAATDALSGKPETSLSCEVSNVTAPRPPLPRPKDCNLDWGQRFYLLQRGRAGMACHGDTIANATYPVLQYGKSWRVAGFTCDATRTRVRCVNLERRGFELSRARQVLF